MCYLILYIHLCLIFLIPIYFSASALPVCTAHSFSHLLIEKAYYLSEWIRGLSFDSDGEGDWHFLEKEFWPWKGWK